MLIILLAELLILELLSLLENQCKYGYSAEGEVNTINQLPVAVYALVEFVGGSTTTGLLIGTNASYLYDPSPAVANPTIAAIAFSENGPFQDGVEYITTLDWNGKTISLG